MRRKKAATLAYIITEGRLVNNVCVGMNRKKGYNLYIYIYIYSSTSEMLYIGLLIARGVAEGIERFVCLDGVTTIFHATTLPPPLFCVLRFCSLFK